MTAAKDADANADRNPVATGGTAPANGGSGGHAIGGGSGHATGGAVGGGGGDRGGRGGATAGGLAGRDGGSAGGGGQAGACIPLTCDSNTCFPGYCDDIGDGCGGTLHCSTSCQGGYFCIDHVCSPEGTISCPLNSCVGGLGERFCGAIAGGAMGCPRPLMCPTCPDGWQCQSGRCIGLPDQCTKRTCNSDGSSYCGLISDGCGGRLACNSCPIPGWVCQEAICVGPPDVCVKGTCLPGPGVTYCGSIGDGCGATLKCPSTCADGTTCGAVVPGACGTDASAPPPPPPPIPASELPGAPALSPCPTPPPAPS